MKQSRDRNAKNTENNHKGSLVPIILILFSHLIVCSGCGTEQKKSAFIHPANIQDSDSISIITNKSTLQKEDILSWDYDQAIVELGEPVSIHTLTMADISEFNIELLNFLPADPEIKIRQLTFEADDEMYLTIEAFDIKDPTQLKDMYLTIWYVEKDGQWKPVDFLKYNKDTQF